MYMDDIKLFAKNKQEWKTLILTVKTYSQDIVMEFGIKMRPVIIIKSGKWHMESNYQIKTKSEHSEKENVQIPRNNWSWHHQTTGNETNNKKKSISEESENYVIDRLVSVTT